MRNSQSRAGVFGAERGYVMLSTRVYQWCFSTCRIETVGLGPPPDRGVYGEIHPNTAFTWIRAVLHSCRLGQRSPKYIISGSGRRYTAIIIENFTQVGVCEPDNSPQMIM